MHSAPYKINRIAMLNKKKRKLMNQTDENNQPEHTELEQPIASQAPNQPETEQTPSPEEGKAQPGRFGQFIRKALLWLLIITIAFLGGFFVDYFLRYRPLADDVGETNAVLDRANQAVNDLQTENERLQREISTANNETSTLKEGLEAAKANIKYFQILVDVNNARINLFLEDIEGAQASLEETQARLEDLLPLIENINPELAISLPRRLDLIVSGLARDPETGRIDLELFTKDLLELQPLIFGDL